MKNTKTVVVYLRAYTSVSIEVPNTFGTEAFTDQDWDTLYDDATDEVHGEAANWEIDDDEDIELAK